MLPRTYHQALKQLMQLEAPPQTTREANPVFLSARALLRGLRPPRLDHPFVSCEVFAGQGLEATMSATVFPKAHFHVVSDSPASVALGREIARTAGVENVQHMLGGLEDLENLDIPPCDFLCLHDMHYLGGPEALARLKPFLQRCLAPGGLLSVSYQALPGMHDEMQVRLLLRQLTANGQGDLDNRLKIAVKQARTICKTSRLSERLPQVDAMLERLERGMSSQMARELLHPDWQPLYFHQPLQTFQDAGLHYMGQAALHYDIPPLLMSAEKLEAYAPHDGTPTGEYLKGLLAAQTVRYDVYHNGAPQLKSVEHGLLLGGMQFARLTPPSQRLYEAPTPHGTVQLQPELVDPVYAALEQGSATYAQMLEAIPQQDNAPQLMHQVISMLVDAGQLHPMINMEEMPLRALFLDRVLLERFIVDNAYNFAMAPRLGGGMQLSWETQAMRLIEHSGVQSDEEAATFFLQQMENAGRQLLQEGRPLEDPQLRQAQALRLWQEFRQETLPLLEFLQGPEPREASQEKLQAQGTAEMQ